MPNLLQAAKPEAQSPRPDSWLRALASYREPDVASSVREIAVTAGPFLALWVAAWATLSVSYWLTLAICVPAAGFMLRLFLIQHDCGHGAFFEQRKVNDWVGRVIGVLTLTPYDVWRRSHAIHHATSGNLDRRGIGDIDTLTVREYLELPTHRRVLYRLYRNPIVMFGLGPAYMFLVRNRLPLGMKHGGREYWLSVMGTNLSITLGAAGMIWLLGAGPFLMVHLPILLIAASIGVWLFYIQHQFEETHWAESDDWQLHEAALHGSSYYDLPRLLHWLTANIGMHHIHHLSSRIPCYRLPQVLRDHPELLETAKRLSVRESLACVKLRLWCEQRRRLVSFREALAPA